MRVYHSVARLIRFIFSKDHMMKLLRAKQVRSLVIASCLFGLCLLSGCGSSDSSSSAPPGAASPRFKKFQEIKVKNEEAKKYKK